MIIEVTFLKLVKIKQIRLSKHKLWSPCINQNSLAAVREYLASKTGLERTKQKVSMVQAKQTCACSVRCGKAMTKIFDTMRNNV